MMKFEDKSSEEMLRAMGPGAVDTQLREAIRLCWMILPVEKRTVDGVRTEIRRLVDRALKDLEEDATVFGIE